MSIERVLEELKKDKENYRQQILKLGKLSISTNYKCKGDINYFEGQYIATCKAIELMEKVR